MQVTSRHKFTNELRLFKVSQNSLCVTTKLAQITVERENNCFGLTLRGGGDFPLIVTNVRPHGPVFKTGRIKPGDRLLRVDNVIPRFLYVLTNSNGTISDLLDQ